LKNQTIILSAILVLYLAGLRWVTAGQPQESAPKPATVEELVKEGNAAYSRREYAKSAKLLQEAIEKGARETDVIYNAACSTALAGDKEQAFRLLDQAILAGWRKTDHLKNDRDLNSLHDDPRWPKLITASDARQAKYLKDHSDPNRARFVTVDIERFWKAYDKAISASAEDRIAIFERDYIDPGTIGLKDFRRSGRLNAKTLVKVIEERPSFFRTIRPFTSRIEKQRAETIAAFRKLKRLYPDAIFPNVYFVIGQMQSGGTASDNGLLMGAEMFTRTPGVPMSELTEWQKGAIMAQSDIPPLVAHESIHFQQKYPAQVGLLCQCLKEGSADFLGELTSGRLIKRMQEVHVWANVRERQLWEEFQKDMTVASSSSRWLYGLLDGL
jgi:tetratricopeptide (TPR) repeat protein